MPVPYLKMAHSEGALREKLYSYEFVHDYEQVLGGKVVVEGSSDGEVLMWFAGESDHLQKDLAGNIIRRVATASWGEVHGIEFEGLRRSFEYEFVLLQAVGLLVVRVR